MSLVLWIVGGVLALAFGIWAGLGYPGLLDRYGPGPSRSRRMGTWLNWLMEREPRARPRRFSVQHLIVPKAKHTASAEGESQAASGEDSPREGDE